MRVSSTNSKKVALFGIFLAYMLVMAFIERLIPLDGMVPGMRLGLANLAVVISLYMFSFRDTLLLVVMKCFMTFLLSGSAVALIYSMSGTLASFAVMQMLIRLVAAGPIGVSVAGAAFHNTAQIVAARFILGTWGIAIYLPFLLVVGTVSGVLIGILTKSLLPMLRTHFNKASQ